MRMLIVDDDLANCQLIKLIVKPYGDSVIAENGDRAVKAFFTAHEAKDPFEIVFLDIMMPGKDGHQVLKEIREWEEKNLSYGEGDSKIVMISALDSKDHILSSFKEGCEYYLVKPVSKKKVEGVMAEMGY